MKTLLAATVVSLFAIGGTACAKEEPKAKPVAEAQAKSQPAATNTTAKAPDTKRSCIKVTDAKTGKEIEKCRDVKIHKKLEGTEIPPKK